MPRPAAGSHVVPFDSTAESRPPFDRATAEAVTSIGPSVIIKGELHASEHVIINGRMEGTVDLPEHGVAIGVKGCVDGRVFAKSVTILGTVKGTVTAEERTELRHTSHVEGRLVAARIVMDGGAFFRGPIDTSRADIATRVARYRTRREEPPGA